MPPSLSLVKRWFLSTLSANATLAILGLATGILAARLLGPTGRGELAAIQLLPAILSSVALLGLGEALTYFAAREPSRTANYVSTAVGLAAASAVLFILAGTFAVPYLLGGYSSEVLWAARLYLFFFLINAFVGLPHYALRGAGQFEAWNGLRVLPPLVWLAVLLFAWISHTETASTLALIFLGTLALLFIPFSIVLRRFVVGPYAPTKDAAVRLARIGMPSAVAAVPQILTARVDQIVIAATLPAESLGLYAVAAACGGLASPITTALSSTVVPLVASRAESGEQARVLATTLRVGVLVALLAAIAVAIAVPLLLRFVFGSQFLPALPAALVLVVAAAVGAVNAILEEGFRGMGRPEFVMRAHLAGAGVGPAVVLVLVPGLGIVGASIGTVCAMFAVCATLLMQGKVFLGLKVTDMVFAQKSEVMKLLRATVEILTNGIDSVWPKGKM